MTEEIEIAGVPVYVSKPEGAIKGGLILIHEVWGLNDHIKNVADRYAKQGYLVYAPDLLVNTGIEEKVTPQLQQDLFNPEKRNEIQPLLRELMAPIQSPDFATKTVAALKAIFEQLYSLNETNHKVAVLGFCFGGTYSYNLAVAEPRLVAAVPFYGHADQPVAELKNIKAPILAFFGEKDSGLIDKLPDLKQRMQDAGVNFTFEVYKDCGHAFFNETNPYAYNEAAAKDSWDKSLNFLRENLS